MIFFLWALKKRKLWNHHRKDLTVKCCLGQLQIRYNDYPHIMCAPWFWSVNVLWIMFGTCSVKKSPLITKPGFGNKMWGSKKSGVFYQQSSCSTSETLFKLNKQMLVGSSRAKCIYKKVQQKQQTIFVFKHWYIRKYGCCMGSS